MGEVTVVATQFDGVTKIVREGEIGFLVEPVSSTTWAEGYYAGLTHEILKGIYNQCVTPISRIDFDDVRC